MSFPSQHAWGFSHMPMQFHDWTVSLQPNCDTACIDLLSFTQQVCKLAAEK